MTAWIEMISDEDASAELADVLIAAKKTSDRRISA